MALGQGKGQSKESPAIYLAAFGKHPGWDDHIEDIGIETDLLAKARRVLYSESISGNIDAGSWEKLGEDQRLAGFAHDFVWWIAPTAKEPAHVVVGRLWSSRDGKGRSKYPMAVYAQGDGIPLAIMAREVLPALAALERRCVEATSADAVRSAIDSARTELRSRFAIADGTRTGPENPSDVLSPAQVSAVLSREEFGPVNGPVREGLARAMYAVDRDFVAFLPLLAEGRKSKSLSVKPPDAKGAHLRLPSLAPSPHEAALVWISLLSRRLSEGTSILAIAPRGESFVDVVAGDVGPAQLYAIRASAKGFPLTTDVPYAIDDAYRASTAQLVAKWSGTAPPSATPEPAPAPKAEPAPEPAPKRRFPRFFLVVGGGIGVVALGSVALLMRNSGAPTTVAMQGPAESSVKLPPAPGPPEPKSSPPTPSPAPATATSTPPASSDKDKPVDSKTSVAGQEEARTPSQPEPSIDAAAQERARQQELEQVRLAEQKRVEQEAADKAAREAKAKEEAAQAERVREQARQLEEQKQKEADAARIAAEAKARELAEEARKQRSKLQADIEAAAAMLSAGARLSDAAPDGRTLERVVTDIRSSTVVAAEGAGPQGDAVLEQVSLLSQIGQSDDIAFLTGTAVKAATQVATGLAASERLAALGWPTKASEWDKALEVTNQLRQGAQAAGPQAVLRAGAAARSMWIAAWRSNDGSDAARDAAVIEAMPRMQADPAGLDPLDQFNVLVVQTRLAAGRPDAKAVELASGFASRASSLAGLPAEATAQVQAVQALIDAAGATPASGPVLDRLGPGSLPEGRRWKLESTTDGWATFAAPDGGKVLPMEFVKLTTSSGDVYVLGAEVSLGLFCAAVDSIGGWQDVPKLGRLDASESLRRKGPAVWVWTLSGRQAKGMQPGTGPSRSSGRGWFDSDAYMAKTPYFDAGQEPAPPSREHPMQYVSPAAAMYAARALGCRLPTVEEASALAALAPAAPANRRDGAWMAANEWLAKRANGRNSTWLDDDIFLPEGVQPPRHTKAVAAVSENDGVVLFRPVAAGGGSKVIRDAVGNVGEFVFEDIKVQDSLPADPSGLREALQRTSGLRVIGGSALSPGEVQPGTAYPVRGEDAAFGFSDVGFRLAFSAAGQSVAESGDKPVLEALQRLEFIRKKEGQ